MRDHREFETQEAERRYHLAGPLGTSLLRRCFDLGLLRRGKERRAVSVTAAGARFLASELGVNCADYA